MTFNDRGDGNLANQTNDLRIIRRRKKRKHLIKRLLSVFLIVVISLVGYSTKDKWLPVFDGICYKFKNSISKDDSSKYFPMKIDTSTKYDIESFQDRLVLLTDTKVTMFNRDGKETVSAQHGMANPIVKVLNERALIYDLGGNKIIVESRSKNIFTKTLDDKIVYAQLSSKGYLAVVTGSDISPSVLTVYNSKGTKIFYSSLSEKILDIVFNKKSSGCVVTTFSAKGGQFVSKQYSFKFDEEKEEWEGEPIASLVLTSEYNDDGNIILIGDTQYNLISDKGEKEYTFNFKNDIIGYDTTGDLSAMVFHNSQRRITELVIIDSDNKPKTITIDNDYRSVHINKEKVYILTKKSLKIYSSNGELLSENQLETYFSDFTIIDNQVFLIGSQVIERIDL